MKAKLFIYILIISFLAVLLPDNSEAEEKTGNLYCSRPLEGKVYEHNDKQFIDGEKFLNSPDKHRKPSLKYFLAMKEKFKRKFKPVSVLRKFAKKTFKIPKNICAVAGVSVDKRGKLTNVFIISPSNYEPYDKKVIKTIKRAANFGRPPKELLKEDESVHMAWTFRVILRD